MKRKLEADADEGCSQGPGGNRITPLDQNSVHCKLPCGNILTGRFLIEFLARSAEGVHPTPKTPAVRLVSSVKYKHNSNDVVFVKQSKRVHFKLSK